MRRQRMPAAGGIRSRALMALVMAAETAVEVVATEAAEASRH